MVVRYADGASRHRRDTVTSPLGHGQAGLPPCSYADGQEYAEGGRRHSEAYAEGACTPRGVLRGWAGQPTRRRPRHLAVGVRPGRRHTKPFL
jgi:hypothetical protein